MTGWLKAWREDVPSGPEIATGKNFDAVSLAKQIKVAQNGEIGKMKKMLSS